MEPAITAALIATCGVLGGAAIGGFSSYRIARKAVKADIKRELSDEMHEQLVWLRRKVREGETAHRESLAMHQDCERKLLNMRLEVARLTALAPRDK
jgi:uncharacterized coiled-coil DUF342 family protein